MNLKKVQQSVRDYEGERGKTVLLRCDLNITEQDNTRIFIVKPTIDFLVKQNFVSKIIICTHLGRPKGNKGDLIKFSINQTVLPHLKKIFEVTSSEWPKVLNVSAYEKLKGTKSKDYFDNSNGKPIILLENLRFHQGEESNDVSFANSLANLADFYVNDAFSVSHRLHASVSSIGNLLPSYAGLLLQKEMEVIEKLSSVDKGFTTLVIGGAKIEDKIGIISNLLEKVDRVLIGGGMVKSFLTKKFGNKEITKKIMKNYEKFLIPQDVVKSDKFSKDAHHEIVDISYISGDQIIMDIGPLTIDKFSSIISKSDTIIWNGSMGVFEWPAFEKGTKEIALSIINNRFANKYAGGGSTIEAINRLKLQKGFTHISSGGGAFLAALEGKQLPGIIPLLVE